MSSIRPRVSVAMTVYNQEKYVGEAIEGVIRQQTSFPFELIVADDCSTDGTREICEQYAAEHPDVVRYRRRERNLGMMANFCRTLEECDGDYIAICEGDDYWIDVNKLQLQFDFLETHDDFSMACHNHYQLRGTELVESYSELKDDFRSLTTTDYMLDPHFQTASYFLRRSAMPKPFPEWYSNVLAGDHFLVLLLSLEGKIGFFNRRMSVFRVFATSMTGSRGPLSIKENFVEHLRLFDIDTKGEFSETIRKVIRRWDLAYKVYEPIGYFSKLFFFIRNLAFYISNFERVGGLKLGAKYVFSLGAFERVKQSVSPT